MSNIIELPTRTEADLLRQKDAEIERLRTHNGKLADSLERTLLLLGQKVLRVEQLEEAAADVLPTLELYFSRMGPLPEWHPVAALRRLLEEGR